MACLETSHVCTGYGTTKRCLLSQINLLSKLGRINWKWPTDGFTILRPVCYFASFGEFVFVLVVCLCKTALLERRRIVAMKPLARPPMSYTKLFSFAMCWLDAYARDSEGVGIFSTPYRVFYAPLPHLRRCPIFSSICPILPGIGKKGKVIRVR